MRRAACNHKRVHPLGIVRTHPHNGAGTRSHPPWFADPPGNRGSTGFGARAGLAVREGVCTRLRARIVVARRQRRRDCSAASAVVLARAWGALRDGPVRPPGHRRGRGQAACADPRRRRVRHNCGGRPTNDRCGIPDRRCFLATYTTRLSAAAKAQHLPLGKALQEYSGTRNRERLLSLLMTARLARC
jgi:hypothetical protein